MELRQYWRIVWRRWWLIATMLVIVSVVSLITYREPAPAFQATMRFSVGIEGIEPVAAISGEGRSDAWLASEYLADDLSEVLKGGEFAALISRQVDLAVPAGRISASREHRIMSVSITWHDQEQVGKLAGAVVAAVEDGGAGFFPQLGDIDASAVLIDGPHIGPVGRSLKDKLDLPIRLLVAMAAGVALAFLWEYLDDTVRDRAEAEALGVDVLGEIPRKPLLRRRRNSPRSS
jgi:capsular polysaccharide biosynthesis protein